MKIAQIVCTFPPYKGGMGNVVYNFSNGLAGLGHDVTILTPDYSTNNNFFDDSKLNFKILRLKPWFKYGNAGFIPQLFWKLDDYDIAHLHYPFFGAMEIIILLKLFFRKKIKLIVHYHMDAKANGFKGLIFKLSNLIILPILLRQAKIITYASIDYIKHSNIAKYYDKNSKKFRETLFGVDLKRFKETSLTTFCQGGNSTPPTHSCQGGGMENQKNILFVGGLDKAHYFKGLENLLQAVKILKNSHVFLSCLPFEEGQGKVKLTTETQPTLPPLVRREVGFNLTVIGEGDLKNYYKNLVKNLKIDKIVNFPNQVDNSKLVDYYNDCDVFVLPSISQSEAFGLVLLEAMACAKPVIATDLPGVRGVFENNRQGLIVKPGDVYDLVEKLKIILTNNNLAKQMGQAGRKLVEDKYAWEKVCERLGLIYNS
ncbi:MAG: glycosyltransferase family 4 protein [Patescibacteria group bacterium]